MTLTTATGPYTTTDSVTGSFTVSIALGDSLTNVSVTPSAYTFTDGVNTYTNANSTIADFSVSTSATGAIANWYVDLVLPSFNFLVTEYDLPSSLYNYDEGYIFATTDSGYNKGDQGSWELSRKFW